VAQRGEFNPYQPPTFDEGSQPTPSDDGQIALATRWERLGASIIDGLLQMALLLPLQISYGVYDGFPYLRPRPPLSQLVWGAIAFVVYLALHSYLLSQRGQTIGKRLVGIRIVNFGDREQTPFAKIVVLRQLLIQLVVLVPTVGPFAGLIDMLLIFRKDRRCLHDHIAGTVVVKATKSVRVQAS